MAKLVKREGNRAQLSFTIEEKAFKDAVMEAFKQTRGKYNVPGFRKGKAPKKMIENMYGEGVFYNDALNLLIPDAYDKAIEELGLFPVSQPEIDIENENFDCDIVVIADVDLKPEFELPEYKGLKPDVTKHEVNDADIEAALKKEQEKNSRLAAIPQDAASQIGDSVIIDYKGYMDGEAFAGGEAKNHTLKLGTKSFIDTFEDQLVGKKAGEEVEVNVTFPEDYHEPSLAGKPAKFEVKIHDIKREELPELNDDFAMDVSEFDTLEEFKADLAKKLEEKAEKEFENEVKSKLVEMLTDAAQIDIPDSMVDHETDHMLRDFDYQLRYQGLSLEQYMALAQLKIDDLKLKMKEDALKRVKTQLCMEKLIEKEGLRATQEEIDEQVKEIVESQKIEEEKVREFYGRDDYAVIREVIESKKAVNLLYDLRQ